MSPSHENDMNLLSRIGSPFAAGIGGIARLVGTALDTMLGPVARLSEHLDAHYEGSTEKLRAHYAKRRPKRPLDDRPALPAVAQTMSDRAATGRRPGTGP